MKIFSLSTMRWIKWGFRGCFRDKFSYVVKVKMNYKKLVKNESVCDEFERDKWHENSTVYGKLLQIVMC